MARYISKCYNKLSTSSNRRTRVAVFLIILWAALVLLFDDSSLTNTKPFCEAPARELPMCEMPALILGRPNFNQARQRRNAAVSATYKYHPNQTFFRPPYYGQPGLNFNGSFTPWDLFTDFDKSEWREYCNVADGVLNEGGIRKMIVPDRVVFLFVHNLATWEEGMMHEQVSPSFYRMDRVREGDGPGVSAVTENSKPTNLDSNPVVMTIHLTFSTEEDPVKSLADIAATISCLKEHMLMWYSEATVKQLMSQSMGTMMLSDRTPMLQAQRLLNGYETFRLGDWKIDTVKRQAKQTRIQAYVGSATLRSVVTEQTLPTRSFIEYYADEETPKSVILPRIATILSVSDERAKFVEMARMMRRWRLNRPEERSHLRQYSLLRIKLTDAERSGIERFFLTLRFYRPGLVTPSRLFAPSSYEIPTTGPAGESPQFVCNEELLSGSLHDVHCSETSFFTTHPISKRPNLWAFVGTMKKDRPSMIKTFRKLSNETQTTNECCGGKEPEQTYKSAMFVPIGKGQLTLDCSRIYEAPTSGAIAVIARDLDEIANTFMDFGSPVGPFGESTNITLSGFPGNDKARHIIPRLPPFVFADSWTSAASVVKLLAENSQQMQRLQYRTALWQMRNYWHLQERTVYGREGGSIRTP